MSTDTPVENSDAGFALHRSQSDSGTATLNASAEDVIGESLIGFPKDSGQDPGLPVEYTAHDHTVDAEDSRLHLATLTRSARDGFRAACAAIDDDDEDRGEANFYDARDALLESWEHASLRSHAFNRLLGLLDAAIRRIDFLSLGRLKRDVILHAFEDLTSVTLSEESVTHHVRRFTEAQVSVTGPIQEAKEGKFRVKISVEDIE